MDKYYANSGKKIMAIAKISAVIICVSEIITGLAMIGMDSDGLWVLMCLGIILLSPVTAYLSTILVYAFGKLVDSAENIENKLCGNIQSNISANDEEELPEI